MADVTFEGIIFHDQGVLIQANDQFFQMFGYEPDELIGTQTMEKTLTPESIKTVRAQMAERSTESYTAMGLRKDGTTFPLDVRVRTKEVDGKQIRVAAIRDISRLKSLEAQLLQAQKMEAIGTLAGGIAHDFNNLLQIVLGYSQIMLDSIKEGDSGYSEIKQIYQAGGRGAELVKSLMTVSRKAESQPKPINLNEQVEQLSNLLARTFPPMIEIERILHPNLATVNVDPTQMDQVLMNLAVNAKDAIAPIEDGEAITGGIYKEKGQFHLTHTRTELIKKIASLILKVDGIDSVISESCVTDWITKIVQQTIADGGFQKLPEYVANMSQDLLCHVTKRRFYVPLVGVVVTSGSYRLANVLIKRVSEIDMLPFEKCLENAEKSHPSPTPEGVDCAAIYRQRIHEAILNKTCAIYSLRAEERKAQELACSEARKAVAILYLCLGLVNPWDLDAVKIGLGVCRT